MDKREGTVDTTDQVVTGSSPTCQTKSRDDVNRQESGNRLSTIQIERPHIIDPAERFWEAMDHEVIYTTITPLFE